MQLNRLSLVIGLGLALAACSSSEPPPQNFPDIRFDTQMPLHFDVSKIDVVSQFQPSFHAPEVDYNFPVPPQRAIENWAHDRLQAGNVTSANWLRVTILDASVIENPSPPIKGQDVLYTGHLEVRVDVLDEHGLPVRTATAVATRNRTEPGSSSPNQIDSVHYLMTKDMTQDLTNQIEKQMNANFYPYLLQ